MWVARCVCDVCKVQDAVKEVHKKIRKLPEDGSTKPLPLIAARRTRRGREIINLIIVA